MPGVSAIEGSKDGRGLWGLRENQQGKPGAFSSFFMYVSHLAGVELAVVHEEGPPVAVVLGDLGGHGGVGAVGGVDQVPVELVEHRKVWGPVLAQDVQVLELRRSKQPLRQTACTTTLRAQAAHSFASPALLQTQLLLQTQTKFV